MRLSHTADRSPVRLVALAVGSVGLLGAMLAPAPSTAEDRQEEPAVPSLFSTAPAAARSAVPPAKDAGRSRLVTLDASALPRLQGRVGLPLTDGEATARVDAVDHEASYTAWRGHLEGVPMSSFALVQVDDVYRGAVISPEGVHTLTQAEGDRYWLTEVAPREMPAADDAVSPESVGAPAHPTAGRPLARTSARRGTTKIRVLAGYTRAAKIAAGSKAGLEATAALAITQTNEAFANSGVAVKLKLQGVVKTKGRESDSSLANLRRLVRTRDGRFDNLQRVRRKHRADIVHLFYSNPSPYLCGAGMMPPKPRRAHPVYGASTSTVECMPFLVFTHEIGHNLGADHTSYPGITHSSQVPYSYGYYNVPGNYISVMSYYEPCTDVGVYTCTRVPYFSSPVNTYNGQPLAVNESNNNTRVVKKTAPRVARYVR